MIDKNSRKTYKETVSKYANDGYWECVFSEDAEFAEYLKEEFDVSYIDFLAYENNRTRKKYFS